MKHKYQLTIFGNTYDIPEDTMENVDQFVNMLYSLNDSFTNNFRYSLLKNSRSEIINSDHVTLCHVCTNYPNYIVKLELNFESPAH